MLAAKGCQLVDWLVACQYGTPNTYPCDWPDFESKIYKQRMLHGAVYSTCGFPCALFDHRCEGLVWWDIKVSVSWIMI